MAQRELSTFSEEKRQECMDEITKLNSNDDIIEEIRIKSKEEIDALNNNFSSRKDQVVDFLFKNVINVKYEVPDVVKGFFEEKFGITE